MKPCPNCQVFVAGNAELCSNCGYSFASYMQEKLLTGIAWLDIFLGVLAGLISPFVFLVGAIVALVLYFTLRRTYSAFARGLLIGLVIIGVVVLGGLALCIGIIAMSTKPH